MFSIVTGKNRPLEESVIENFDEYKNHDFILESTIRECLIFGKAIEWNVTAESNMRIKK